MKKRIAVAALCFVLTALLLCSCAKTASVTVNSQKIDAGVYAYFTDRAKAENADKSAAEQTEIAKQKLCRYVAINTEFANRGLSLDPGDKNTVAETVDSYWHTFGNYFEGVGVTRQDIYKIELNKAYEKALMLSYYSKDGDKPVSDETLKQYFSDNFVAFRAVTGFLTTVDDDNNAVSMTDAQKQPIINSFNSVAADINEHGAALLTASSDLQDVSVTEDIVVVSKNNAYPEGFYDKIREIETGKAAAFVIGDYIFCAERYEILSDEYSLFSKYRTDCLSALKGEEFSGVVDNWTKAFNVD